MRIPRLLIASSPRLGMFATAAGLVSGLANAGVIAVVNFALTGTQFDLTTCAWLFVVLVALKLGANAAAQLLLNRFAQRTISNLRRDLSRRILAAPLKQLEELGQPRLFAVLTDDVMAISEAFRTLPRLAANLAILAGCGLYLLWLSPLLVAAILVFGILGIWVYRLMLRHAIGSMRSARTSHDAILKHVRSLTEGTKELKLNAARRRAFIDEALASASREFESHNLKAMARLVGAFTWTQFVFLALIGLLLFVLPLMFEVGAAVLTSYVVTTLYVMGPLTIVVDTVPVLSRAEVALQKIDDLGLSLAAAANEKEAASAEAPPLASLALQGVRYSYATDAADRRFTLGPIDLEFTPGTITFIVGGNGSGKSTLAKLIAGLYAPDEGTCSWNGARVSDENRDAYRQNFAAVFSDFYLFDALLGIEGRGIDDQARHYLSDLRLEHKVEVRDGVLSTTALSQGQRKRLALLVAWLEDRPAYVFDEWAADQDPEFKRVFYERLLGDLKAAGKIVVVISHDDRWFDVADRRLKLDEGRVTPPT